MCIIKMYNNHAFPSKWFATKPVSRCHHHHTVSTTTTAELTHSTSTNVVEFWLCPWHRWRCCSEYRFFAGWRVCLVAFMRIDDLHKVNFSIVRIIMNYLHTHELPLPIRMESWLCDNMSVGELFQQYFVVVWDCHLIICWVGEDHWRRQYILAIV